MLAVVTNALVEVAAECARLPVHEDPEARYTFFGEGQPFVVPVAPASESERLELLEQVRRVVARVRPHQVLKVWPGKVQSPNGGKPRDMVLVQVETLSGSLVIAHAEIQRGRKQRHPKLGQATVVVFDGSKPDEQVFLPHGGGVYLDLWRGHSRAKVH